MTKRKQSSDDDNEDASSSSDVSVVDVSFEFFDPNPNVDFHAIKRLLKQLFQRDADQLQIDGLTELILNQPTVGTTIKTDGIESDPFALLTVLNMHLHHQNESMKAIANYFLAITATHDPAFHATLQNLFSQSDAHVGLVICERLVNMPVQVIPPMYDMLSKEIKWALADREPYNFTHLIIVSRVYHLSEDEESALVNSAPSRKRGAGGDSSSKKQRKQHLQGAEQEATRRPVDGIYPYHPEDDVIIQSALHSVTYPFVAPLPPLVQETRSRDAFGLDIRGRLMLLTGGEETLRTLGAKMTEVVGTGL